MSRDRKQEWKQILLQGPFVLAITTPHKEKNLNIKCRLGFFILMLEIATEPQSICWHSLHCLTVLYWKLLPVLCNIKRENKDPGFPWFTLSRETISSVLTYSVGAWGIFLIMQSFNNEPHFKRNKYVSLKLIRESYSFSLGWWRITWLPVSMTT